MNVWVGDSSLDVLIEPVRPPPRLFVLGGGHDVVPVVDMARTVGWETVVCVPSSRVTTRERLGMADALLTAPLTEVLAHVDASDRALALVIAHDYERDRDSLAMLLASRATYIGVLGPLRRTARMLEELGCAGSDVDERVHAPVGLELGAESPAEIALAIVAEMQASLTRTSGSSLRMRSGPIHAESLGEGDGVPAEFEVEVAEEPAA